MEAQVGDRLSPGNNMGPIAAVYVNTIMFGTLRREKIGLRSSREALTLATAIDQILKGSPAGALD
eukprot:5337809-Karenia_brevis.AAC.1